MTAQEFQLYLMKHDLASQVLVEQLSDLSPIVIDLHKYLREYEMYQKRKIKRAIRRAFESQDLKKTPLVVYGSGNYHHYTYGLCREVADKRSSGYTYVHIDQHTDFGSPTRFKPKKGDISCGDFVCQILEDTHARPSVHIGQDFTWDSDSQVAYGTAQSYMFAMNLRNSQLSFRRKRDLFSWMKPEVYVTIDLDVLKEPYVQTDYDCGDMDLSQLLETLGQIKKHRRIIGLDICGLMENQEHEKINELSIQTHREIIKCVSGR